MIYEPKKKTAEELLIARGFTTHHAGARGWVRPTHKPKREACIVQRASTRDPGHRLHALIHNGKIYLHFDKNENGTHKTGQFGKSVQECIKEFAAVDV